MRRNALSDERMGFTILRGTGSIFGLTAGYRHEIGGGILHLGKNYERARDKGPDFLGPNSIWQDRTIHIN